MATTLLALVAAVAITISAVPTLLLELQWYENWRAADGDAQEAILFAAAAPLIHEARQRVDPHECVLLASPALDPAIIPYYLHPRRIFQTSVRPETDDVYMKLPPPFPTPRAADTFACAWGVRLDVDARGLPVTAWEKVHSSNRVE
jgi:hypothetical protein